MPFFFLFISQHQIATKQQSGVTGIVVNNHLPMQPATDLKYGEKSLGQRQVRVAGTPVGPVYHGAHATCSKGGYYIPGKRGSSIVMHAGRNKSSTCDLEGDVREG